MGRYTPTILGGNSYQTWFYDRGTIKDPAHTRTSKGLSQAINRGPIRKFLPKYAHVYVTIQSHGLSAGAQAHYVTANGLRNRLAERLSGAGGSSIGGPYTIRICLTLTQPWGLGGNCVIEVIVGPPWREESCKLYIVLSFTTLWK